MIVFGSIYNLNNIGKCIYKYTLPHYKFPKSVKEEASFAPRCILTMMLKGTSKKGSLFSRHGYERSERSSFPCGVGSSFVVGTSGEESQSPASRWEHDASTCRAAARKVRLRYYITKQKIYGFLTWTNSAEPRV